jgi:translation elongation factor P/translation initiation factor 5A
MFRRLGVPSSFAVRHDVAASSFTCFLTPRRNIFADKLKIGSIVQVDKRIWRVSSTGRSQKGQGVASFHIRLTELRTDKKKEMAVPAGVDFPEVKYERVKLLFSGFDDDDNACFVYPQHTVQAGKEVNVPATSLQEHHQKFLCVGMPVDLLHVMPEDEEGDEMWAELNIPTGYDYTVDKLSMKGMYKMASFKECDGMVSVSDAVQPGDRIKVIIRPDGTASFNGKVGS